jgi:predicted anti-sigma-YlaC factor YlaD
MNDHPSQWMQSGLTCRTVSGFASEYLDDHLPMLTKIRVSLHLVSCADCRTYMKQMALVCEVAASLPKQCPSPINRLRLQQHFAHCHSPSL